jgi:hypothetical protein
MRDIEIQIYQLLIRDIDEKYHSSMIHGFMMIEFVQPLQPMIVILFGEKIDS